MPKKIQGEQVKEPFSFSAKDVIQEPKLNIVTEAYPVGEREYGILKQKYCADWLNPIAFASLGVFLAQAYPLIAHLIQIYIHIGDKEEVVKLKESQGHEIDRTIIILILSGVVFVILLIINRYIWRTPRNKLLKKIRQKLDVPPTVIASKPKGKSCD